jgi:Bacterial regulatory protein, Fis family
MSLKDWLAELILVQGKIGVPANPRLVSQSASADIVRWIDEFERRTTSLYSKFNELPLLPSAAAIGLPFAAAIGPAFEGRQLAELVVRAGSLPDSVRPALRFLVVFPSRIDSAAVLLSAAFAEAAVTDFPRVIRRPAPRRLRGWGWYTDLVHTSIIRSHEVRRALVHRWKPTARAERLALNAFTLLSELTPSANELFRLCQYDRPRAFVELAKQLEASTHQFELAAGLLAEVEAAEAPPRLSAENQFTQLREELLEKAGGRLSLTEAARLLGMSRQALHKRIKAGSVLGMMHGTKLVLPKGQFLNGKVLPGFSDVLKLFEVAGAWSALQFLVEPDPNVGERPLEALAKDRVDDVLNAAKAYLDSDED